jgi:peptide/nickel transport system substrate-binding protein
MVSTPPGPTQPRSCETFRVSRREALAGTTKLGLGASFVAEAARHWQPTTAIAALQGTDRQTLTVAANWAPVDIDPHGAYDVGSGLVISGPFESLIALKPGSSREYVPVLAESWESNEDLSAWTFRLRNGVVFHDGTLCDAEAVRVSFERMFALALPPSNVLKRFIQSIDQIQVLDNQSILFDLGRPQLMFEAAMAAPYGMRIMNVGAALQHEVDADWGHGWTQANTDGLGTGPYRVTSFEPGDRVVMERFDDYWGGWEGEHFERIVIRVVAEAETRRQLIEQGGADIVENISRDAVESLSRDRSLIVHRQTNFVVHYRP